MSHLIATVLNQINNWWCLSERFFLFQPNSKWTFFASEKRKTIWKDNWSKNKKSEVSKRTLYYILLNKDFFQRQRISVDIIVTLFLLHKFYYFTDSIVLLSGTSFYRRWIISMGSLLIVRAFKNCDEVLFFLVIVLFFVFNVVIVVCERMAIIIYSLLYEANQLKEMWWVNWEDWKNHSSKMRIFPEK